MAFRTPNTYRTCDPLPRERERELIGQAQAGDQHASDLLVRANMRFVISYCNDLAGPNVEVEDLYQEAAAGLVHAINTYDRRRRLRLISYAKWWIRSYVYQYFKNRSSTVRVSGSRQRLHRTIHENREQREKELQRNVSAREVIKEMDLSEEALVLYQIWADNKIESLNDVAHHEDKPVRGIERYVTLIEKQSDANSPDPLQEMLETEDSTQLEHALDTLPARSSFILRRLYGLHPDTYGQTHTLQEVADELSITRERVRQIRNACVQRLKKSYAKNRQPRIRRT